MESIFNLDKSILPSLINPESYTKDKIFMTLDTSSILSLAVVDSL